MDLSTGYLLESVRIKLKRLSQENSYQHSISKTSVDDYDAFNYPMQVSSKTQTKKPRKHQKQNKEVHAPQQLLSKNTKPIIITTNTQKKYSKYGTSTEKRNKNKNRLKFTIPTKTQNLFEKSEALFKSTHSDLNINSRQSQQSKEVRLKEDDDLSTSRSTHLFEQTKKKYDFPKYDEILSHMLEKVPTKNVEKISNLSTQQKKIIPKKSFQNNHDTVLKRESINNALQTFPMRRHNVRTEIPEMRIDLENSYKLLHRVSLKLESIDFTSLRNQVRGINLSTLELNMEDPIRVIKQKERYLKHVPDLNNFYDVCSSLNCMARCPLYSTIK